jgi:hypothetical protein
MNLESSMNLPKSLTVLAGVVVIGVPSDSYAVIVDNLNPSAMIVVETEGEVERIPLELISSEKGWSFSIDHTTAEFGIQGEGFLNPDPSIAYGLAVVDFGAPSVFGFFFGTPIVPTGPSTVVSASVVGGLTDFLGDGVALTPTGATLQTSAVSAPASSMGVDVGAPFSAGPGSPGAFYAYGPYSSGPIGGPAGVFTFLSVSAGFGLSGGGDIAALTGFAEITTAATPTPDLGPGFVGWLSLGGCLVLARYRQRAMRCGN